MEKIMIYVNDKLPIIIAYLIIFAEIVGQMLLKKFFNKEKGFLHTKVKTACIESLRAQAARKQKSLNTKERNGTKREPNCITHNNTGKKTNQNRKSLKALCKNRRNTKRRNKTEYITN